MVISCLPKPSCFASPAAAGPLLLCAAAASIGFLSCFGCSRACGVLVVLNRGFSGGCLRFARPSRKQRANRRRPARAAVDAAAAAQQPDALDHADQTDAAVAHGAG